MKVEYSYWLRVKNTNKAWCRRQAFHIREVFDRYGLFDWQFLELESDSDQATTVSFHILSSNFQ